MIINISLCLICDYFKFIYLFIRYYFFYYKLFTHELTICESIRILVRNETNKTVNNNNNNNNHRNINDLYLTF